MLRPGLVFGMAHTVLVLWPLVEALILIHHLFSIDWELTTFHGVLEVISSLGCPSTIAILLWLGACQILCTLLTSLGLPFLQWGWALVIPILRILLHLSWWVWVALLPRSMPECLLRLVLGTLIGVEVGNFATHLWRIVGSTLVRISYFTMLRRFLLNRGHYLFLL